MSKLRWWNESNYSASYGTGTLPLQFENFENEDDTIFNASSTSNISLLKPGAYKISFNFAFATQPRTAQLICKDSYGRTLSSSYKGVGTYRTQELVQSYDKDELFPNTNIKFAMYSARSGTYGFYAGDFIEIEYLGDINSISSIPSDFSKFTTLLQFFPFAHPVGYSAPLGSDLIGKYPYSGARLYNRRDLGSLEDINNPYYYTIRNSGTYEIKYLLDIINHDIDNNTLNAVFRIYINATTVAIETFSNLLQGGTASASGSIELDLEQGDNIAIYWGDDTNAHPLNNISVTNGWIGITQKETAPAPNIAIGGFVKVEHYPTTVAFELEKVTFEKDANEESLVSPYEKRLYRQFLYQDVIDAKIIEEEYEATLELTVRKEAITNFLYFDPENTYQITYFEKDNAGRERSILFFLNKILDQGSSETNSFVIVASQKGKIVSSKLANNQNHILGTTESDLQVNENSSTSYTYPETWNKYLVTEPHLDAIENIINRNLINPYKLDNGTYGNLAGWRIMPGLLGVSFTDLGDDYEQQEVTLELTTENTIQDALEQIYDQIGHRLDWEIKATATGYYINFFAPNQVIIDWDDTLTFIDSYTFTKDYTIAKVISAFGSGFNEAHTTNYSLVNKIIRPEEEFLDVKETARNSETMARKLARLELPKTKDLNTAMIAFKSGGAINFYDTKPRTLLTINRHGQSFNFRISAITITIDKNGVNHIYDLETLEE